MASTAGWLRRRYSVSFSPGGCARAAAIAATLLGGLAGGLYVAREPILTWIGQQLVDEDPLAAADAIVVLVG